VLRGRPHGGRTARWGLARAGHVAWIVALAAVPVAAKEDPQRDPGKGPQGAPPSAHEVSAAADPNLAARVNDAVSRQVWKSRISALAPDSKGTEQDELEKLMERVRAAQLRPRPKDMARTAGMEPPVAPEIKVAPTVPPAARETPPSPPADVNTVPRAPFAVLDGVDPNAVTHPLRMAEILRAGGHLSQAAPFYQQALARLDPQDQKTAGQRQWILLQLGRCWREDQPTLARQMFSQLIMEYPDSPWLDLAKAWQGLADWVLTDQPWRLVEETRSPSPGAGVASGSARKP